MDLSLGSLPGMARTSPSGRRQRGHIRKRGGSFQVLVYAGLDPLTGKDHYLSESTRNEAEAQKILTRPSSMCLRCHRSSPLCARRVMSTYESCGAGGSSGRADRRQAVHFDHPQ
jgi:hypothetical protein